ncbi:Crp/Fnr family transcriptional regulator [Erythrobacter sp.]|jgi:CRP-like cAMP-binding protein|uniref:Crp/Fnr family transcriptional regulator n=1 Tax=Erythrobacter sp. TaxID=1042 RepID=UPI002E98D395|nr:Crp/Fnr family transcriptional regulator [Erythrobacter sp.]
MTGNFLAGRLRHHLSKDDLRNVEKLVSEQRSLSGGEVLVARGERVAHSAILVDGFMFRTICKDDRRFIVGVHVPGDFVDLHGFALKSLDHNLVSVGATRIGVVPHDRLTNTMRERPGLARAMWFATLLDAAIHRKWIQMLERLDAPRRIAHIYCELQTRLGLVGRAVPRALRAPFTQLDLGDMCGVSAVHANRAVSKLREIELAEIRRGTLYTRDWDALRKYAQFDPSYLYGDGPLKLGEGW